MIIREANHEDIEQSLVLGWEMHQESSYKGMSYNLEKVADYFQGIIEDDSYLFLVAELNSRIVGGFIGYAIEQWFSDDLTSSDIVLFIDKAHRGGTTAMRLIKKYISWAKEQGVAPENIGIGITTGVHTEKTKMLYEKMGFALSGVSMIFKGV